MQRKHAFRLFRSVIYAVTAALLGSLACSSNNPAPTVTKPIDVITQAQVEFITPVSISQALDAAHQAKLNVTELRHTFRVGDMPFRGFLPVNTGQTPDQIRANLKDSYDTFLADELASFAEKTVTGSPGAEAEASFSALKNSFQQTQQMGSAVVLSVDGLTVEGTDQAIGSIQSFSPVTLQITLRTSQQSEPTGTPQGTSEALSDPATWAPKGGTIAVLPSGYSGCRYVSQDMYWTNVSGFVWNSTYEHDFFLNHSPGPPSGTYLDRSQYTQWNYRGIPIVEYATSNLPRAYLDTRFSDPSFMIAYSIGAADADAIAANTWYNSYIRVRNGDRNTDNAKLAAQRGRRLPPNDYSTWGSYSIEQVDIFPAWSIPIPCGFSWQR